MHEHVTQPARRRFLGTLSTVGALIARYTWPLSVLAGQERAKSQLGLPEKVAWKAEFLRTYGLKQGEVLKRIAPPYPACRIDYCKFLETSRPDSGMDFEASTMFYRWNGESVEHWAVAPGVDGLTLITVLKCVGVPWQEVEAAADLRSRKISGEFVVRTGATEKAIPRLEQILRDDLHEPVRLTFRRVEREVIVVGGQYESRPRANRKKNQVDLYAVETNPDASAGGGSGTFEEFLAEVGGYIGQRIVNEVPKSPTTRISWFYHNSTQVLPGADPNQEPEGVLKNVTAQTGLTFKRDKRTVRVLLVEKD
jgi:hypothetical protein